MTGLPGRCRFDARGWLQGPIRIEHMTSPNHWPSGFASNARGLVQHTEDGFTAGTVATFMSETAEVSAFFGVGEDGAAQQFLPVGRGWQAWAQAAGNQAWRSCECEDKTKTGQPMTDAQLVTFAQILEACSAFDGFPLQLTDDPLNGRGLITHGDGGESWGNHPGCPGPVRRAQRPVIIQLAKAIRAQGATVSITADGKTGLQALATAHGTSPARVLHLTATAAPAWPAPVHAWLQDLFTGRAGPDDPIPAGCAFQVPAP